MSFSQMARLARFAGWLAMIAGIIVSVVPGDARPHTSLHGPAEHLLAYLAAGALLTAGYRGRISAGVIVVFLVAAAAVLEFVQYFVPGRHADPFDVAASGGGAIAGAILARLLMPLLRRYFGGEAAAK